MNEYTRDYTTFTRIKYNGTTKNAIETPTSNMVMVIGNATATER
jgi:hypothetical protein